MNVAVVGAGPAGALLALHLARDGATVTLFDASHPREKPCGGGVTAKALALLPPAPGGPPVQGALKNVKGVTGAVNGITHATSEALERLMDTLGLGDTVVGGVVEGVDDVLTNTVGRVGDTLDQTVGGLGDALKPVAIKGGPGLPGLPLLSGGPTSLPSTPTGAPPTMAPPSITPPTLSLPTAPPVVQIPSLPIPPVLPLLRGLLGNP